MERGFLQGNDTATPDEHVYSPIICSPIKIRATRIIRVNREMKKPCVPPPPPQITTVYTKSGIAIRRVPRAHPTWTILKDLANKTQLNTERAILELKNELKRLSGRVVDSDHLNSSTSILSIDYVASFELRSFTLQTIGDDGKDELFLLRSNGNSSQGDSDSDSDTVPSEDD